MRRRLTVLIDLDATDPSHHYTVTALEHAIAGSGKAVDVAIVRTDSIGRLGHGVMIGPGSPYRDPVATETVIERARRSGIPLVGT
jgi:hypothetical protein